MSGDRGSMTKAHHAKEPLVGIEHVTVVDRFDLIHLSPQVCDALVHPPGGRVLSRRPFLRRGVVAHYDRHLKLGLSRQEVADLIAFLQTL